MAIHLELQNPPSKETIKQKLGTGLPQYKIKSPPLNPSAIMVQDGAAMVLITRAEKKFKIKGGVNTSNFGVALGAGIGVLFGFVGAFIFLGIVHLSNQERFGRMEGEVAKVLEA